MSNTSNIAFLFDLDGVIIDSESIYTEIWSMIGEEFPTGVPTFAKAIKGCTLEKILDTYYPDPDVRQKVEARLYEEENKIRYRTVPGAVELLDALKASGVPAALVTSSNGVKMAHLWEQHPELKTKFDAIITGDDVTASKPDPEGYIEAAYRVDGVPLRCAVVEDSLQGVKAGRNAGSYVIGVAGTLEADVLEPYSDEVVNSVADIDPAKVCAILKARG